MWWLVSVAMLGACGRLDFDPLADAGGGDALVCPTGYTRMTTGCYRFVINPGATLERPWPETEMICEADGPGSHLLVIDDAAELALATTGLGPSSNAWIGASDRITEGTYLAVTGAPAFVVWDPGQPTAPEDCIQLLDTGTLGTRDCTMGNDYLCEYDGVLPAAGAF